MAMLTALLRLRQVCCDLRLLGQEAERPSGKLELLEELLEEAMDGGHRVLLFSQFVSMLRLIRARMDEAGIRYGYLDGETKDRAKAVDEFQRSDNLPLFLISLKAGGVGLNLSAADTVIHFDPWWNPAVEAQATDRAHRLGQTRVVTSYKLIARATVEEKILRLQQKKRDMIQSTVESEEPVMNGLSMAEIYRIAARVAATALAKQFSSIKNSTIDWQLRQKIYEIHFSWPFGRIPRNWVGQISVRSVPDWQSESFGVGRSGESHLYSVNARPQRPCRRRGHDLKKNGCTDHHDVRTGELARCAGSRHRRVEPWRLVQVLLWPGPIHNCFP